jgi:hypothetical protein
VKSTVLPEKFASSKLASPLENSEELKLIVPSENVHPRVAMQILRHSKIAVAMEIYTEIPSAATREALKKLGEWLGN